MSFILIGFGLKYAYHRLHQSSEDHIEKKPKQQFYDFVGLQMDDEHPLSDKPGKIRK